MKRENERKGRSFAESLKPGKLKARSRGARTFEKFLNEIRPRKLIMYIVIINKHRSLWQASSLKKMKRFVWHDKRRPNKKQSIFSRIRFIFSRAFSRPCHLLQGNLVNATAAVCVLLFVSVAIYIRPLL